MNKVRYVIFYFIVVVLLGSCRCTGNISVINSTDDKVYYLVFFTIKKPKNELNKLLTDRLVFVEANKMEVSHGTLLEAKGESKIESAELNRVRTVNRYARFVVIYFCDTNDKDKLLQNPNEHILGVRVSALRNDDIQIEYGAKQGNGASEQLKKQ